VDLGLHGKTVMVTGASSGIGRVTALAFAQEGARLAVTYQQQDTAAQQLVAEIEELGADAVATRLALEEPASIDAAFADVASVMGGVDVLVANAIAWPGRGELAQIDMTAWAESVRVNVEGAARCIHAGLVHMRQQGWGRVVIVSTGSAEEGLAGASAYGTAKSALHGLARSLAWEVGQEGVLVNVVAAGFTETERNRTVVPADVRRQIAGRTPTRRLSQPDEVAALIKFLGSAANGNLSGEIIREGSSTGRSAHAV
jgi:NAD(P)-dependent dehydrogenase (short-subunit alcohol dehydrogenase family)